MGKKEKTKQVRVNLAMTEARRTRWKNAAELRGLTLPAYIKQVVDIDCERPVVVDMFDDRTGIVAYPGGRKD